MTFLSRCATGLLSLTVLVSCLNDEPLEWERYLRAYIELSDHLEAIAECEAEEREQMVRKLLSATIQLDRERDGNDHADVSNLSTRELMIHASNEKAASEANLGIDDDVLFARFVDRILPHIVASISGDEQQEFIFRVGRITGPIRGEAARGHKAMEGAAFRNSHLAAAKALLKEFPPTGAAKEKIISRERELLNRLGSDLDWVLRSYVESLSGMNVVILRE